MASVPEPSSSRFRSAYDDLTLIEAVVPAVVRVASSADPLAATQAAYDAARAAAGYADAPSAAQTARRLARPWPAVVTLAFGGREPVRSLGAARRRDALRQLDVADVAAALQRAARHAGSDTLRPAEYDRIRQTLIARMGAHGYTADSSTRRCRLQTRSGSRCAATATAKAGTPL